jgi:hypothetical protein
LGRGLGRCASTRGEERKGTREDEDAHDERSVPC